MRFPAIGFHDFCALADDVVDALPPVLLRDLNGGVQVERGAKRNDDDPPGVHLLGEYIMEPYVGRLVLIYYGSFRRVFADDSADTWRDELGITIRHELRHHIEALGGIDYLGEDDKRELARLWQESRDKDAGNAR